MFVMKETMILKPLGENEKTKNDKTNRKKIRDLMQLFFEKNILISFEDMLERLEMTEKNYIQTIRSTLSRTKIFLKRQSNEVAINAYNKTILTLLESNMDIQFVLDPYSCASYMINYVTKVDAGLSRLLKEAAKDLENGNLNIRQKFRKIANVFINGNTMSAQEAVYHVLGLPLSLCSRAVVYINTAPRKERVRMLKNDKHLKKISDESTDIYYKNIIDKYENRNYQKLPDVCLAEFAANYEEKRTTYQSDSENEYNENIEIRERKKQKIIRFRRYKLQEDRYNYFREQVLLFLPWKNETDDVETQNCETLYKENIHLIENNRKKFAVIGDAELDNALTHAQQDQQDVEDEEVESFMNTKIPKEQEIDIFGQTGVADCSKDTKRKISSPPKSTKEEMMRILQKLNDKQREITIHVLHCFKTGDLPIKLYISGSAGVGKSTVINAIYQLLLDYFNETPGEKNNSVKILLCAPSGKAAFLIGGVTLHTAFALPITQYGGQMPELSADVANTIRENLIELKLLIIDEISMVGSTMFSRVDTRLRQIMGRDKSFGGVSVLVVGDLYQLPPVMDTSIYLCPKSCMLSVFSENVLWNEFEFFQLTEVMRQKEDKTFIEALNNLAKGTMCENDIALIKSRETTEEYVPKDAIRLYADNHSVDSFNQLKIDLKDGIAYESIAKDTILGKVSSKLRNKLLTSLKKRKRTECGGLAFKVILKIGIKYMIITNIDVEEGLVNGACGILKNITFKPGTDEPIKIWLDFNNNKIGVEQRRPYIEYMTENCMEMCLVPLSPLSVVLNVNERMGYQIVREQFPITPAEAMTIHKSQGQTYEKVCVDLRNNCRMTKPMLYVALSRVTKLSDLYILGSFTSPKKPSINNLLELEIKRLKEEKCLKLSYSKIIKGNQIKIIYQNVRSLNKNLINICCDKWYKQADLLIFAETQTITTDNLTFEGFNIIFRTDNYDKRLPKGIICFIKKELNAFIDDHIQKDETINGQQRHIDLIRININEVEIITGYKSPSVPRTMFTHELSNILRKSVSKKKIIIGDFNYDSYNKGGFLEKHLNELQFKRAISTQVSTTNFNTQIDVIFISEEILNYSAGVYETYFSDHKPIFIGVNEENKRLISSVKMLEKLKENSSNKNKNSEEHLFNVMSEQTNEAFRKDKKESVKIADTVEINPSPQTLEENVLEKNSWLDDRPLNEIMKIIENNTQFKRVDVLFITGLHWVNPIFTPDVQIVGGCQAGNHWHCIYYDGVKLHIYDSLYFETHTYDNLTLVEQKYIKKRYPNLTENNVIFEKVTKQPDLASCGIFAAAFAISIARGENPSIKKYSTDMLRMRRHCLKIIKEKKLLPFPEE